MARKKGAAGGPLEALNRLAAGKADMAVSDINLLIKFRDANGTAIRALFTVFDKPPYAVVARKSHGVLAPRDLQGKKLGAPAADPTFAQWPIFAKVADVDGEKEGRRRPIDLAVEGKMNRSLGARRQRSKERGK